MRFSEAPGPGAKGRGRSSTLESWRRFGQERCFRSTLGLGSRWEEGVPQTRGRWGREARESFVVGVGSGLGSVECGKLQWPWHPRTLPLGDIPAPAAAGHRGSGLCLTRMSGLLPVWRGFPALGPIPRRSSSLGSEDSICSLCVPLGHRTPCRGLAPAEPSSKYYVVPLWKGGVGRGKGGKTWLKPEAVLANQTRPLQGPGVLDCPDYLLRLKRCLAGSGALHCSPARQRPPTLHMTPLGWEVSLPLSQMLCFFSRLPTVLHGA